MDSPAQNNQVSNKQVQIPYSSLLITTVVGLYLQRYHPTFYESPLKLCCLLAGMFLLLARRSNEPYGLFHLSLNERPGQPAGTTPQTEWLNMGFWKDTEVFPEAAEALAIKLIRAAELTDGSHVLDVGHGTGESLITLLSHPSVPRLSHITGITSIPLHHERSRQRVENFQSSGIGATTKVHLFSGDAVLRPSVSAHPFLPKDSAVYNAVIALDCAYHFDTRWTFLEQAHTKLVPGGRVALADMCWEPSQLHTTYTRVILKLLPFMPQPNVTTTEDYINKLESTGYDDIQLEDITEHVFPGFFRFLRRRNIGWWIFVMVMKLYVSTGIRFVIISGRKP